MSLRTRLVLQFAAALLMALGLQTLVMVAMTRRTVTTIVESLGGRPDALFVTALLERWQSVQWMYASLNATLILFVWVWLIERTIVRPLRRLEDDVERFSIDEFVMRLSGDSDLQRIAQGIQRMTQRTKEHGEALLVQGDKLKATEAQLTRAEQLAIVGRLSAGLAHEIGNPLGAVIGYVALVGDENDPQKRKDIAARADRELQRINGLIRELLDYARPAPLRAERVELLPIVKATAALLSHQPRGQSVTVSINVTPALFVLADAARLQQILLNIFLNGADAMAGSGTLTVTATADDRVVTIAVRDQGPGFSADALQHASEPFFTTKGPSKGTGLGLAVCQTLVREQGGRLEWENDPSGGAIVRVSVPVG